VIRIGTRASALALWQAEHVAEALRRVQGAPEPELVLIKTEGDRIQDIPLSQVQGKAFFTKEIEEALLTETIDLAVHSLKDLATEMPSVCAGGLSWHGGGRTLSWPSCAATYPPESRNWTTAGMTRSFWRRRG
jgi:hypothetical protein